MQAYLKEALPISLVVILIGVAYSSVLSFLSIYSEKSISLLHQVFSSLSLRLLRLSHAHLQVKFMTIMVKTK